MQNFTYLFAGYTVIFVILGFYFVVLGSKISNLEKRVEALDSND
ncbi:MAG: CcmD family protein [Denitrovibrio sp.]|nr:MAG: CcmD family protein [Denitrovibrio sp.]